MKNRIEVAARIALGLIFVIFGLNGFFQFIPLPLNPEKAQNMLMALAQTGYFFPLLKGLEVICGLLLLSGLFVPLALTVLAPIVVNIFLFHTVLAPQGAPLAITVLVLELVLAWSYRTRFAAVVAAQ